MNRNKERTVLVGGYIKTTLLDAAFIQASIINTGYIEGLAMNFVQGTIGGIEISANSITSSNALFSVSDDGEIYAQSGLIGDFSIVGGSLECVDSEAKGIILTNTGDTLSARIGVASGSVIGGLAVAEFINKRASGSLGTNNTVYIEASNAGAFNTALTLKAAGGTTNNALYIESGNISVSGIKNRGSATTYNGTFRVHDSGGIKYITLD